MNASAIVMMIFGLGVVWGGFAYCAYIAQKKQRQN